MKKLLAITLSVLLSVLGLTACGQDSNSSSQNNSTSASSNEKISVVATIFPQYDFVRQVAGDNVELTMLLSPGAESHSFEPTPQDIITIQNCDVFIYVGGESDSWVDEILDSMDTTNMEIISLMGLVDVVEEEVVEGMEDEEDHDHDDEDSDHADEDHEEEEYDEHVWTSPKNAKIIVQEISNKLCEIDSSNSNTYKNNTEEYVKQLDELDTAFQEIVDSSERTTVVFGDRFPFRYFADAYGLTYYAAFPGCSTETEASAETVAFLIDKVNDDDIPVVFYIEFSNQKIANTICESSNAEPMLLHSCHNITADDFESGATYLELMQQNADNLREALN